ncbi:TIM barrel protein [SAR202 cluster bacterium AD-812-D07_MRT_10900m]|jgi:sugar phosphate isomerase/epimerase|nr:TIM barrel protein [SAR202 cluster bacterium AD-812-D07_MRT_10900m]|tara:strand:- start:233 stop:1057 length:825 start_codon:yes stop_codon:yes gene_type:complete
MTWKLSAFADEIGSDPELQFSTLENLGVGEIQLRGAWDKNVMELSTSELTELKSIASSHGLGFHGIGSPLGKLNISEDVQISIDGVRTAAAAAHAVGATRVRVFSFYYDSGVCPESIRTQVIDRLGSMLEVAEQSGVTLIHENEKDIYGDTGDRCLDLAVNLPALGHCFDFSNFVQCDEDTLECWNKLRDYVVYFDVKDAIAGSGVVVPAGEGDGRLVEIFSDAISSGYDDRFNLEPHLSAGGQFGGSTSLQLFEVAVNALNKVLVEASVGTSE